MKHNPEEIEKLNKDHRNYILDLITMSNKIENKYLVSKILDINNFLHEAEQDNEKKYEAYNFKTNLSTDEKLMLDRGEKVEIIHQE